MDTYTLTKVLGFKILHYSLHGTPNTHSAYLLNGLSIFDFFFFSYFKIHHNKMLCGFSLHNSIWLSREVRKRWKIFNIKKLISISLFALNKALHWQFLKDYVQGHYPSEAVSMQII